MDQCGFPCTAHARKQITITLARCTDPCQLSSCGQLASQPARQDARAHSDSSGGAPAQFSWLASGGQLVEANHGSSQPAVVRYLAAHRVGAVSCSLSLNLNSFPPMRNQCETSAKPMRNQCETQCETHCEPPLSIHFVRAIDFSMAFFEKGTSL